MNALCPSAVYLLLCLYVWRKLEKSQLQKKNKKKQKTKKQGKQGKHNKKPKTKI